MLYFVTNYLVINQL